MSTATDLKKSELLDRATQLAMARKGSGGPPSGEVGDLIRAYYRHIGADDLTERTDVDLYAALASQFRLADNRPQGRANVHVHGSVALSDGTVKGGHWWEAHISIIAEVFVTEEEGASEVPK